MTLDELVATFQRWLHLPDPAPLYAVLGAVAANRMSGDPVWLMLVGPPSSGKSEILQALTALSYVFPAATLNEAALLSGTAEKDRDQKPTGGLLRQIGEFGIIMCKDFTSILSMNREAQRAVLAALREIYDGRWTRRLGSGGGMTLDWKGKVGLIAGCTHAIEGAHAVTAAMGERFILLHMPPLSDEDEREQTQRALTRNHQEARMRTELVRAIRDFWSSTVLPKVPPRLQPSEDDRLAALATLIAHGRSAVERHSYSREIERVPPAEVSTRLFLNLKGLLSGMRVIGVSDAEAWWIVQCAGLDSLPAARRDILVILAQAPQLLTVAEIADQTVYSIATTRRTLEDLQAHGIAACDRSAGRGLERWCLTEWAQTRYQLAFGVVPEISGDPATSDDGSRNVG
jgi:DNA-binding transcriptional ArsR family regulator